MYNILYKIQNFEAKGKIICSRRQKRDTVFEGNNEESLRKDLQHVDRLKEDRKRKFV